FLYDLSRSRALSTSGVSSLYSLNKPANFSCFLLFLIPACSSADLTNVGLAAPFTDRLATNLRNAPTQPAAFFCKGSGISFALKLQVSALRTAAASIDGRALSMPAN